MRDFLILLIVFGSVPVILVRPQVGILLWYWISLMNPHRLTWGYAYQFRVALVVGAATLVAWMFSRERKVPPATSLNFILALFTIWFSISTIFALVPDDAFAKWQEVIKIVGMTFVTTCIVNSKERIRQLVWVVALSIAFYGVKGGVFSIFTGGKWRIWGPPGSFIEDNNQLALALIMILPLLHYLTWEVTRRWIKLAIYATMGFTLIATLCTYSRGGFIALTITLFAFWLKAKRRVVIGVASVFVMGLSLAFLPQQWWDRMSTIETYKKDTSANERLTSWVYALRLTADHPLTGGGFEVVHDDRLYFKYAPEADAVHNFHSIYFQVLGENGYPGLIAFVSLIVCSLLTAQSIIRRTKTLQDLQWANRLASAIQVAIVGYCSAGAFVNLGFYDLFYVLVATLTAMKVVIGGELAKRRTETRPVLEMPYPAHALSPSV